jgi:hypothetical protein
MMNDDAFEIIKMAVEDRSLDERREVYSQFRKFLPKSLHESLEETIETVEIQLAGHWILRLAKRFFDFDTKTAEGRLKLYHRACGLVTVGALFAIFQYRFGWSDYFQTGVTNVDNWTRFLGDHGAATLLLLVIMGVYRQSRVCVKTEMSIFPKLFPLSPVPKNWEQLTGSGHIGAMILFYMVFYLGMAFFTNDVRIVSAGFATIYTISYFNQWLTRKNIEKLFTDPLLQPSKSDVHRDFILDRRKVAWDYLFGKPHLWKESAVIAGNVLSFIVALIGNMQSSNAMIAAAYVILIITLVGNEIVVWRWRVVRQRLLAAIDENQYVADLQRLGGRASA